MQPLATGDLICWTDDDVLVEPAWLNAYVDAAARRPNAGIFDGTIRPWFEHEPPVWLRDNERLLAGMLVAAISVRSSKPSKPTNALSARTWRFVARQSSGTS